MPRLLPTFGILIFITIYFYSASIYPGGSLADANSVGYDWFNNLWCHLMNEHAINGQANPARSISIFAAVILCVSMIIFFFQFAKYFVKNSIWKIMIKASGIIAMASAAFIFTNYHDVMTTVLSICGLLGITAILRSLHLQNMTFFKIWGIICVIVIGLNNLFYYNENYTEYLPMVQLIDFVLILSWTVSLNLKMIKRNALIGHK